MFIAKVNSIWLHFVLPLFLLFCILFRVNFQSLIYLLFLFALPILFPINKETIKSRIRNYLTILLIYNIFLITSQLSFQIVLIANQPYGSILKNCSFTQNITAHFGYYKYNSIPILAILRTITPDLFLLAILIVSIVLRFKTHKQYLNDELIQQTQEANLALESNITRRQSTNTHASTSKQQQQQNRLSTNTNKQTPSKTKQKVKTQALRITHWLIPIIRQIFFLALLAISGGLWPSILSIPYFILFLFIITYWSCKKKAQLKLLADPSSSDRNKRDSYQPNNSNDNDNNSNNNRNINEKIVKIFLLVYLVFHLIAIYLYQINIIQNYLPRDNFKARLIGLNGFFLFNCEYPVLLTFNDNIELSQIFYPLVLFAFYWILALEISYFNIFKNYIGLTNPQNKNVTKVERIDISVAPVHEKQIRFSTSTNVVDDKYDDEAITNPIKPILKNLIESNQIEAIKIAQESTLDTISLHKDASTSQLSLNKSKTARSTSNISGVAGNQNHNESGFMDYFRSILFFIMRFLHKQSYLLSLLTMMAWSITYHSILTFVLLIWACLIWVLPRSREKCLSMSPFFVFYGICLICLQFIYGTKLNSSELIEYKQIGLVRYRMPFVHLLIKIGYMLPFWLTLQQHVEEERRKRAILYGGVGRGLRDQSLISLETSKFGTWIHKLLIKYWIFISSGMLLLMSCQNEVVSYRIVYMVLFLYFLTTFQMFYKFWRLSIYVFHFLVVIYSMLVLFLIYVFQFDEVPNYFKDTLNFSDLAMQSIGFEKFDKKDELILKLLTPTTFLIVNILQINYFNEPWLKMTDLQEHIHIGNVTHESEERRIIENIEAIQPEIQINDEKAPSLAFDEVEIARKPKKESWFKRLLLFVRSKEMVFYLTVWRLGEIHINKVTLITLACICLYNINVFNAFLFSLMLLCLGLDRVKKIEARVKKVFKYLVQISICLWIIVSMIYQLAFLTNEQYITHCDLYNNSMADNLDYFGLHKSQSIGIYLSDYIAIIFLLTSQSIITLKLKFIRTKHNIIEPLYNIIFEDISIKQMDLGVVEFIKYLINFFFTKFGLEVCFIVTFITIGLRMDVYALLYGLWLGVFLNLKRTTITKIWPAYFIFLLVILQIEYFSCLGLPPFLCLEYPWSFSSIKLQKLRQWLYFADYKFPPNAVKLVADFFQLYFVYLQMIVFRHEKTNSELINLAGSNEEIIYLPDPYKDNPYHDFTSKFKSYLDNIKFLIYMYSFWFVLAFVFLAGTNRISLLCMGYVILCFFFLWYGQTFLTKPILKLISLWNIVIVYCFCVMFIKAAMQVVLCIFDDDLKQANLKINTCLLINIFGIDCRLPMRLLNNQQQLNILRPLPLHAKQCSDTLDASGLVWDAFCFVILLIQKRLYMSRMFEHVVNELKIQSRLAARGADIFNELVSNKITANRKREERILQKVRNNLERIRQHQSTISGMRQPREHYEAIRSGDYYMFDAECDDYDVDVEPPIDETKMASIEQAKDQTTRSYLATHFVSYVELFIKFLNKYSHDYREVSRRLTKEKYELRIKEIKTSRAAADMPSLDEIDAEFDLRDRPQIYRLFNAIYYLILSQSELLCYFLMVLTHILSASILSLPLPLSVFLWAMLCIPRPNKIYWITCITYTEAVVVIKYLFQFEIYPWNEASYFNEHKQTITILGIEKKLDNFATVDLFLLLSLFLHRSILKRLGLWKDSKIDESKSITESLTFTAKSQENLGETSSIKSIKSLDKVDIEKKSEEIQKEKDEELQESKITNEEDNQLDFVEKPGDRRIDEDAIEVIEQVIQENEKDEDEVFDGDLDPENEDEKSITQKTGLNPFWKFYHDTSLVTDIVIADYYAPMFLCDFINCISIVFSYQYFGESASVSTSSDSNVVSSIQDNKVPYTFLIMFLVQFFLMIVDRALYLRKNVRGKFIFQLVQVIFVHIWMFFALPFITKLTVIENHAAQWWYFVKCLYFGFSSRQISCGYPTRILGNFLTKSYNYVNLVLFKGFLLVPFLLELRALMDWMFTDTSLSLNDWLQMEDIYANIFVLKCFRWAEKKYPTLIGSKRKAFVKYGFGGFLLVVIILIIWFPLLLFSFSEGFNRSVPPSSCSLEIQIGGYLPIYSATSQQRLLTRFTKQDFDDLKKAAPEAYNFLKDYTLDDIYCVEIPGNSTSTWQISPASLANMKLDLASEDEMKLYFMYSITRESSEQQNEVLSEKVSGMRLIDLNNATLRMIYQVLLNENSNPINVSDLYPKFVHARSKGNLLEIEDLRNISSGYYNDAFLALRNQSNILWWDVYNDVKKTSSSYSLPCAKTGSLSFVLISDKVFPSSISFITDYGIIGIYITFVLAISRFIRVIIINRSMKIMFEQLPNVDRIMNLLKDIYLVRENDEFRLEEELYAKLIFIYRAPDIMIKYTKQKLD